MSKHIYNHYAAQEHHRKELKRRHTPYWFANYDSYCDYKDREDEELYQLYGYVSNYFANGGKPYHKQYWIAYTGFINPNWKNNLKYDAHRRSRAAKKIELHNYMTALDYDDYEGMLGSHEGISRWGDPWDWD